MAKRILCAAALAFISGCLVSGLVVLAQTGTITTVAGGGTGGDFSGDGGPATSAGVLYPQGVAVDASGNLFIADGSGRVRRVDAATGIITTFAGGDTGFPNVDNIPATSAFLQGPEGVELDSAGNLFIAVVNSATIQRVDASTGIITIVAGNGTQGYSGDGGLATSANLCSPFDVAVDSAGNLFIVDSCNLRIRRVDASTGIITTVAGNGILGFGGDGGPATSASLFFPTVVELDGDGNLFIADTHFIRRVDRATQIITTVAGTGDTGYNGDDIPATGATLYEPSGLAVDPAGNLFIGDKLNQRIRRVDASTGIITTVAGNGVAGFGGDGGPATSANLFKPSFLALDGAGNLFIADRDNLRVRRVEGIGAVPFDFIGFLQPVDNLPVVNVAKAGRSIPVKWQLRDAQGQYISSLSSFTSLTSGPIACDAAPTSVVDEEAVNTVGTALRYDSATNEFIYNWKTTKGWTGCRLLVLSLQDGTVHFAKFDFR